MERSGQYYTLAILPPREAPQYPLNRRLVGPESCSKHFGEETNFLLLPGIKVKIKYWQNWLQ